MDLWRRRRRLTTRKDSASCIALRSPLSWPARKMRPCHPRPGFNPPRIAPLPRGASNNPQNLKRRKERLKKNPQKTTSGSLNNVALPGADLRRRPLGPQAPKPSARGRKERPSCASSRSRPLHMWTAIIGTRETGCGIFLGTTCCCLIIISSYKKLHYIYFF